MLTNLYHGSDLGLNLVRIAFTISGLRHTDRIKYSHNETPIHKDTSIGHSDDPRLYTPTLSDRLHELLGTMHTVRQLVADSTVERVMHHSEFEKIF